MSGASVPHHRSLYKARLAIVVIGRNEGERLGRCLRSVLGQTAVVVYVDSGSTDRSVPVATELGASVHALDMSLPFTAARARNEGTRRVLALAPNIELIQFLDGDCEIVPGWLGVGVEFLQTHSEVAAVSGRLRERYPDRSVYNRLCDIEWDTPLGEAKACGGIVLMRAAALQQVGGYRDDLIAGEEPELCVRLRAQGWKIWRVDAEMSLHDAAMTRVGQWWKRCMRAGFAYAEGVRLHGAPPERHWVREARSSQVWAGVIPLVVILATGLSGPMALWSLLLYPLQVTRLGLRFGRDTPARWARAFFLVAGKFPELAGQAKAWLSHWRTRPATLIEYK